MSPQELRNKIIKNLEYDPSFLRVIEIINEHLLKVSHINKSPIIITCKVGFIKESHPKIIFYYETCGWKRVKIENVELNDKIVSKITFYYNLIN